MTPLRFDLPLRPPWWLRNGHCQSAWRKFGPMKKPVPLTRQRLELADGDFIDLDWAGAEPPANDGSPMPIVLLVHGLCGNSRSSYITTLQEFLLRRAIPAVAMNLRGCGGAVNRLARAYHSGASEDLDEVYRQLAAAHPRREFIVVGYSLGANLLLKWLGEGRDCRRVVRAVAVSNPFDLAVCSRFTLTGMARFYGRFFLRQLLRDIAMKKAHFAATGNHAEGQRLEALGNLAGVGSLWEFDDRVTAPLHGFRDAADYYAQCSSGPFIAAIETPTMIVQSRDDPMIPAALIPASASLPAAVELRLSERGGHVGFVSGAVPNWLEHTVMQCR